MSLLFSQRARSPAIDRLRAAIEKHVEDNGRHAPPMIRLTLAIVGLTLVVMGQVGAVMLVRIVEQIVQG